MRLKMMSEIASHGIKRLAGFENRARKRWARSCACRSFTLRGWEGIGYGLVDKSISSLGS